MECPTSTTRENRLLPSRRVGRVGLRVTRPDPTRPVRFRTPPCPTGLDLRDSEKFQTEPTYRITTVSIPAPFHARSLSYDHRPSKFLQCREGARRVFTDQAGIASTKARSAVRCSASRMKGELDPSTNHCL